MSQSPIVSNVSYSGVANRRAGPLIFHFWPTRPTLKLIWPYPFIFSGVHSSLCQNLFRPLAIRASGQFRSTCPNQILLDEILDKQAAQVVEFNKCCQPILWPQNFLKPVGPVAVACHWSNRKYTRQWRRASANFADWRSLGTLY